MEDQTSFERYEEPSIRQIVESSSSAIESPR